MSQLKGKHCRFYKFLYPKEDNLKRFLRVFFNAISKLLFKKPLLSQNRENTHKFLDMLTDFGLAPLIGARYGIYASCVKSSLVKMLTSSGKATLLIFKYKEKLKLLI